MKDLPPHKVAEKLAEQGIYVWDGNYYAINVTERLRTGRQRRYGARGCNTLQYT